jgi:hypothetical protein
MIVMNQSKEIDKYKLRHILKKEEEGSKIQNEDNQESKENNIEPSQSWEDYKFENSSLESFEEFILNE